MAIIGDGFEKWVQTQVGVRQKALGDFGAGSSFEVVRRAIGEILEGKKSSEKRFINQYNAQRRYPLVSDIYKTEYKSTSGNDFTDNDLEDALNKY